MKNNFIIIFVISTFFFTNVVFSESFILESKNIEIFDEGEKIKAFKGKAISKDKNLGGASVIISWKPNILKFNV